MKTSNHIFALLLAVFMSLPSLFSQVNERQQVTPLENPKNIGFGLATATDGNLIVATTRMTRELMIFERDQDYWMHISSLKGMNEKVGLDASKSFGQVLALQRDRIIVGAPESPIGVEKNVGLVETFVLHEGKWQLETVLRDPIPMGNSSFGKALASSENTLLIGAPESNTKAGKAFIYTQENGVWTPNALQAEIKPTYEFGASVALIGDDIAVVGAPGRFVRRNVVGSLYIYQRDVNNQWNLIQTIAGNSKLENLGSSLSVAGNTIVAGAFDAVVTYEKNEDGWVEKGIIRNPNVGETYSFASTVNLSPDGKNLIVGASNHAFIYRNVNGTWTLLTSITEDDPRFGSSNAISNDFFLINSPYTGEDMMQGAIYLYKIGMDTDGILLR